MAPSSMPVIFAHAFGLLVGLSNTPSDLRPSRLRMVLPLFPLTQLFPSGHKFLDGTGLGDPTCNRRASFVGFAVDLLGGG